MEGPARAYGLFFPFLLDMTHVCMSCMYGMYSHTCVMLSSSASTVLH